MDALVMTIIWQYDCAVMMMMMIVVIMIMMI